MNYRDLLLVVVTVLLGAAVGTTINGWLPGLIPAWRAFLIAFGVVLIALLGTPIVRNWRQRRL